MLNLVLQDGMMDRLGPKLGQVNEDNDVKKDGDQITSSKQHVVL